MASAPLPFPRQERATVNATSRRSRARLRAVPPVPSADPALVDEFKIARRRMRHLAPWNVEALPPMHSNSDVRPVPLNAEARERLRQLALCVLAVQMWHATARSALQ